MTLIEPAFAEVIAGLQKQSLLECQSWPNVSTIPDMEEDAEPEIRVGIENEVLEIEVWEALQFCSQKAKYVHADALRAESPGYLLFRRLLNEAFKWMIAQHNAARMPSQREIEEYVNQLWDEADPHERQLGQFYRTRSVDYAQTFAGRLARGDEVRWKVSYTYQRAVPGLALQFEADECERGGSRPILRWHCFYSQPPSAERLRAHLRLALYSRQRIVGVEPELRAYHVPTGQERSVRFQSEDWQEAKAELQRLYGLWQRQE